MLSNWRSKCGVQCKFLVTGWVCLVQVLSDDEKRSIYDRYGEAGLKGAGAGGPGVMHVFHSCVLFVHYHFQYAVVFLVSQL
jgi:hypothetical protein